MVLVDTTVWIDFFANRDRPHVAVLVELLEQRENICLTGIILTEVLQGTKNPKEYKQVEEAFRPLIFLEMTYEVFILAADIFRALRKRGITIRKTMDCIIAAVAIENGVSLLHNDRDFEPIGKYHGLTVLKTFVG